MPSKAHLETLQECPPRGTDDMNLEEQGIHGLHTSTLSVTRFHVLHGSWGYIL